MFGKQFDHFIHDFAPFFDVGVLATAKHDGDLNFVAMFEKTNRLFDLKFDIVLTGLWSQANLFGFDLVRFGLFLFALFVLVLAVIHNSANGRSFIGGDFNEVEPIVSSALESVFGFNDS